MRFPTVLLPVLLASTAPYVAIAGDDLVRDEKVHIPTTEEVRNICSRVNVYSCDIDGVEKECEKRKKEFEDAVNDTTEKAYMSGHDETREEAKSRWQCGVRLLDKDSCILRLSDIFPEKDLDNNGEITFNERYGLSLEESLTDLYRANIQSQFGFSLSVLVGESAVEALVVSRMCMVDTNHDGVWSRADDLDGNGIVNDEDRQLYKGTFSEGR